jgi:hypothetical protein
MSRQRFNPAKTPFSSVTGARWIDYPGFIEPCHPTQHALLSPRVTLRFSLSFSFFD